MLACPSVSPGLRSSEMMPSRHLFSNRKLPKSSSASARGTGKNLLLSSTRMSRSCGSVMRLAVSCFTCEV